MGEKTDRPRVLSDSGWTKSLVQNAKLLQRSVSTQKPRKSTLTPRSEFYTVHIETAATLTLNP
jgi:hypothetical protein